MLKKQKMQQQKKKKDLMSKMGPTMEPTLQEYTNFHAMYCGMQSSQRCIKSFDGCAIFASQNEYDCGTDLKTLDYVRTPVPLNLFTYYLLVLVSFTGMTTLFGGTLVLIARDEDQSFSGSFQDEGKDPKSIVLVKSESFPTITVPSKVMRYIRERSQALSNAPPKTVTFTRRFEIRFANYLSVIMCHFVCSNGHKYLVEAYEVEPGLYNSFATCIVFVTKSFLQFLGIFLHKEKKE